MPRLLCIDGGGIRGIIPAVVLAELEQRTGRAACDLFDLLAGTSTGGIIALALTRPDPAGRPQYSAADVLRFYADLGPTIFAREPLHRARTLDALAGPRFDAAPLRRALDEYFGDTRLSHALRDVLVTSYDIERREPFFFKSHHARRTPERDFAMRDVAAATAAGPTYFEPVRLPTQDHVGYRALVDGGVFANNPAMCALVEAIRMFDRAPPILPLPLPPILVDDDPATGVVRERPPVATSHRPHDGVTVTFDASRSGPPRVAPIQPTRRGTPTSARIDSDWLVLSLGTGRSEKRIPYAKARGWGLASWATNIIDIVFDGVSDTVHYQMRQLLPDAPGAPFRYRRLQPELAGASADLGDATRANVGRLEEVGHRLVRSNDALLDELARRLTPTA